MHTYTRIQHIQHTQTKPTGGGADADDEGSSDFLNTTSEEEEDAAPAPTKKVAAPKTKVAAPKKKASAPKKNTRRKVQKLFTDSDTDSDEISSPPPKKTEQSQPKLPAASTARIRVGFSVRVSSDHIRVSLSVFAAGKIVWGSVFVGGKVCVHTFRVRVNVIRVTYTYELGIVGLGLGFRVRGLVFRSNRNPHPHAHR